MRVPSILPALLAVAALAAGCDAGAKRGPASDNHWPGPELTIVQPGPDQIVRRAAAYEPVRGENGAVLRNEDGEAARRVVAWRMPKALIDVRSPGLPADHEGDRIAWSLDGGLVGYVSIAEARRGFELDAAGAHEPGTHLLQAVVVDDEGLPYAHPEAAMACVFHLHAESAAFDRFEPEGETPLVPRRSGEPALFVLGPLGTTSAPRFAVAVNGKPLGDLWRVTWRLDGQGDWAALAPGEPLDFPGLEPGEHVVDLRLEHRARTDDAWAPVARPRAGYEVKDGRLVPSDKPAPGEIDFTRRTFTVQ
ncbi:MAG: hypothetical protein AB7T63_01090 [Planctomycetota bacterium]